MKACIIGLGLMGGSMGLAIKKLDMFKSVVGFDRNELHLQQALSLGLIDESVSLEETIESDVIFLAVPVEGIIHYLSNITQLAPHTTVIDLGSTKKEIIDHIPQNIRKNVVAAHPMCGTENFGPKAALEGLYKDKIVVLANLEQSGELQSALAKEIFIGIGMKIVKMDGEDHDKHAAFISHMPHIISYALANSVIKQEDPKSILTLAGGGFRDMSRIAKSSPQMWTQISRQNKKHLLHSVTTFQNELEEAKRLIEKNDWDALQKWMMSAQKLHEIL